MSRVTVCVTLYMISSRNSPIGNVAPTGIHVSSGEMDKVCGGAASDPCLVQSAASFAALPTCTYLYLTPTLTTNGLPSETKYLPNNPTQSFSVLHHTASHYGNIWYEWTCIRIRGTSTRRWKSRSGGAENSVSDGHCTTLNLSPTFCSAVDRGHLSLVSFCFTFTTSACQFHRFLTYI
jgi:hypothetical protein